MRIVHVDRALEDIIPDFLNYRKEDIENLKVSIEKRDFRVIQTIGHRLSGNAAGYGFMELGPLGEKLEQAAKDENLDPIIKLTTEYEDYMNSVKIEYVEDEP